MTSTQDLSLTARAGARRWPGHAMLLMLMLAAAALLTITPSASAIVTPPVIQTPPSITGTPQHGLELVAHPGTWTGSPSSFSYAWERCATDFSATCTDIEGATSSSYVATTADVGLRLRVRVVATNADGASGPAWSPHTSAVTPGLPVAVQAPWFYFGDMTVGEQLYANPGAWTNQPTSFRHQWFSCDDAGMSCPDIPGATQVSYLLSDSDVDRFVGVEVVATNSAGDSLPAASGAYGPVSPGVVAPTAGIGSGAPQPAGPVAAGSAPVAPPASNAFTVVSQRARPDGSLTFKLRAPRGGRLTAVATASAAALRDPCRPGCSASRPATYGRASKRVDAAGATTLVVKPGARARGALKRRGGAIRVRVEITFKPAAGRSSSQVRSLTVARRAAPRSIRIARGAR